MKRLTQAQLLEKYGNPTTRKAASNVVTLRLFTGNWITDTPIVTRAHKTVAPKFVDAYWQVCRETNIFPTEVQSWNVRFIAGTNRWSLHSWALAWDVFDDKSPRKDPVTGRRIPSVEWFNEMARLMGGVAGQNFRKPDPHHLEMPY